jgi:hypothetical protein
MSDVSVGQTYTMAVEVSTDGGTTWSPVIKYTSPTADISPTPVNVDLSAYKGQTFMLSWHLFGYTADMRIWDIDDIVVSGY